ncbi:MAG: hypothetical protein J07HR59_01474, partial [Halorubrum sp. J07HR59]
MCHTDIELAAWSPSGNHTTDDWDVSRSILASSPYHHPQRSCRRLDAKTFL